jgi:hypothetical protein
LNLQGKCKWWHVLALSKILRRSAGVMARSTSRPVPTGISLSLAIGLFCVVFCQITKNSLTGLREENKNLILDHFLYRL